MRAYSIQLSTTTSSGLFFEESQRNSISQQPSLLPDFPPVQGHDLAMVHGLPKPALHLQVVVGIETQRLPDGVVVVFREVFIVSGDESKGRYLGRREGGQREREERERGTERGMVKIGRAHV